MSDLATRRCVPCEGGVPRLTAEAAGLMLQDVPLWKLDPDASELRRSFTFSSYPEVIGFVNAVAWVAHRENHHPDMSVHYSRCDVRYSTHAVGGLTENDFICAAKVDALLR